LWFQYNDKYACTAITKAGKSALILQLNLPVEQACITLL
jgi:hypothetical protein